ncbi:hypothetical protein BUALT_Bualt11G0081800 [Buddleja alternifolia]|uniref:Scarecrow-like protein 32 n=1 Tax=Buddleja alternifolia TaxID=168488 RepID=A0AAV6X498_9LAMI|nr:hypothetical protein BUALT_Bualt11G0081800 [Buddleja alternifolia]
MKAELRGNSASFSLQNPNVLTTSSALTGCLSTLDGGCIEKLLLHCASALESNDVTLAQQVMWVLNNVASSIGDPNQRLASYFLRALISKASRVYPTTMNFDSTTTGGGGGGAACRRRVMSVTELAGYVDLIPWHRFGFCASNSAILKAIRGFSRVHILDFSITHCMQWPTLIDELAKGPPMLRISVLSWRPPVPPSLNVSIEEVGQRLANFAKFKDVPFEFNVVEVGIPQDSSSFFHYDLLLRQVNSSTLNLREDEALVVNIQNWLRYLPDEQMGSCNKISCRDSFLDTINTLNPCIVTVVDEDCDLGSSSGLAKRITTCFNYLWIPFDALETFMSKNSPQRTEYEADIGDKIENIIGFEGTQRIERLESGLRLSERMENKGFKSVPFCEETIKEVKVLLDEHASGWGMKKDEDMLILTWKGHSSVYATVWVPSSTGIEHWENFISN